ncbi:hypothetical protein ACVWWN_000222 [Mycobacterium sp. URHB0021]
MAATPPPDRRLTNVPGVIAAPTLSSECRGWLMTAGYSCFVDEATAATVAVAPPGTSGTRYSLARTTRGRLRLLELNDDGTEDLTLYAAEVDVVERFLIGVLADEIRDELGLPTWSCRGGPKTPRPDSSSVRCRAATGR